MSTIINYNDQRKVLGDKYFLQYPNGNNIAALWKMFGCVKIEHGENIQTIEFRLFDSSEMPEEEFNMAMMQLSGLFSHYHTKFVGGLPKKVILTPRVELKYLENIDGLTDKRTTKIVSQAEYEKLRSSIGFIN